MLTQFSLWPKGKKPLSAHGSINHWQLQGVAAMPCSAREQVLPPSIPHQEQSEQGVRDLERLSEDSSTWPGIRGANA